MADEKVYVQLSPGAPPVEGVNVEIQSSSEPWGQIVLADGATLKLKTVVLGVARIDSHRDNEGNPVYYIRSQPVIGVVTPPKGQP
jgi:hypothetical protein